MENSHPDLEEIVFVLSGKLLRWQELPFNQTVITKLLEQGYLQQIPAIKKFLFFTKCTRCLNYHPSQFAKIPCKVCNKNHLYCRKCIEMGRIMECEPLYIWTGPQPVWPYHIRACSWQGELTAVQQTASNHIKKAIERQERELLIWAVTGAGKTEMLFSGIGLALEMGKRICIATPRADVVRELSPRFKKAFEKIKVQALYGGSEDKSREAQLIIATTHQLLRFQDAFDVIVVDEVDAFPYHTDPTLSRVTIRAGKKVHTTIYLTATPRKIHQRAMHQKKLPYYFVPSRYHGQPLPVPKMKMTPSLKEDLQKFKPPQTFVHWLKKRKRPERQLLIFLPTISLADNLKKTFQAKFPDLGIIQEKKELDAVHAKDSSREEKVNAFREKKLKVIITTTILERGVTFPSVDVAVLDAGHAVFDAAALVQIAGRAGRNAKDPTGEVLFFHNGKTEAINSSVQLIKQMNRKGGFK